uniref:Uncharacterized protein n=1 Tax=Arundo donax TaxID=35708 RepID=A0A0A9H8R9_ARUDO
MSANTQTTSTRSPVIFSRVLLQSA